MTTAFSLDLFPIDKNLYLTQFLEKSPDNENTNINNYEIILIIDVSGSMCSYKDLYTHYIPNFMRSTGMNMDKKCHILLFESSLYFAYDKVDILQKVKPSGMTAAELPAMYLTSSKILDKTKKYKMFFFTDGAFNNQDLTLKKWSITAKYIEDRNIQCETYAFRVESRAEVIGLLPFLNISTAQNRSLQLFDISRNEFKTDSFPAIVSKKRINLDFSAAIYSKYPFQTLQSSDFISDGDFFLLHIEDLVGLDMFEINKVVELKVHPASIHVFCQYLTTWLTKLTAEKIINNKLDTNKIIHWVQNIQKYIDVNSETTSTNYKYLKNLRDRNSQIVQIIENLKVLNTSAKIKTLNSQQQATFLRSVTDTKLGRSTSKRTIKYDVNNNIVDIIRKEFKQLKTVISELDSVDDSKHQTSFISLETTLGALRAIARELTDTEINSLELEDLLGLLHIVGIGVNAPTGDYPDPMTYHVDKVTFAFVSLADILQAEMSNQELHAPGIDKKLTNVIPIFEDMDLFKFCYKYLKNSLEVLSGIGMRRLLAYIPQTSKYTTLVGLWSIICEKPQKWSYDLTKILLPQLQIMFGDWFDYVIDDLVMPNPINSSEDVKLERQIYIGNNGITNMILPIYKLCTDPTLKEKSNFLPAIYRALYSYELAVIARKITRTAIQQDGKFDYFEKCFVTDLVSSNKWELNTQFVNKILHQRAFIKNLFLLEAALSKSFEEFKQINLTDKYVQARLDIDYDFHSFQSYTLVQAFIQKNKSERCEALDQKDPLYNTSVRKEQATLIDLRTKETAENYIQALVDTRYQEVQHEIFMKKFNQELVENRKQYAQLMAQLPYKDFLQEYLNGFKVQDKTIYIKTIDENFPHFFSELIDEKLPNQEMNKKVLFFIKGGHKPHAFNSGKKSYVFNSGNMSFYLIKRSRKFLSEDEYTELRKNIKIYKYRKSGGINRHGHSNDKPSFFVFGFESYEEYAASVSSAELQDYLLIHTTCCTPFSHSKRRH